MTFTQVFTTDRTDASPHSAINAASTVVIVLMADFFHGLYQSLLNSVHCATYKHHLEAVIRQSIIWVLDISIFTNTAATNTDITIINDSSLVYSKSLL